MRLLVLLKEQTLWQRPSNFMLSPTSGNADGRPSSGGADVTEDQALSLQVLSDHHLNI